MNDQKQARSKPREITFGREFNHPQYGMIYYFNIQFEDGISGEFSTSKREQDKFVMGTETVYTYESASNARGPYTKINKPKEEYTGGKGGGRNESPEVMRSICANVCLDAATAVVFGLGFEDKVEEDLAALHSLADKFYEFIMNESATDKQKRISLQARLKQVTGPFCKLSNLNIDSSDKVIDYVKKNMIFIEGKMKG